MCVCVCQETGQRAALPGAPGGRQFMALSAVVFVNTFPVAGQESMACVCSIYSHGQGQLGRVGVERVVSSVGRRRDV